MEKDRRQRIANQERLRDLKRSRGAEVTLFCAHDVREFEQLSQRGHRQPLAAAPQLHVVGGTTGARGRQRL